MVDLRAIFWFVVISSCAVAAPTCIQRSDFFKANGPYDINLRAMLSSLPSRVKDNEGFYKTPFKPGPNIAHGLGMCSRGTTTQDCSDCITSVSHTLLHTCPNQAEAIDWSSGDSLCLVRYSNHLINGSLDEDIIWAEYIEYKYNTSFGQTNLTEFKSTWQALMDRVINKVDGSLYANSIQELGSFPFRSIYAIAQCNKDLTKLNCEKCLQHLRIDNRSCCRGIQVGYIARTSCFMRWDLQPFLGLFINGMLPTPPSELDNGHSNTTKKDGKNISTGSIVAIAVVSVVVSTVLLALGYAVSRRRKAYQSFASENGYFSVSRRPRRPYGTASPDDATDDLTASSGSLRFDFRAIKAATSNFHKSNKLGHGGFGAVYKGMFPNGTEVAAKRLSKPSDQGEPEFKNEVLLVARLQHKNLVGLLGFSVEGEEKILVYEFVPNKSLDHFLFDPIKRVQLDWPRRHNIIEGITRGILYLHQDSRLTIIHRDLKASNILLDAEMNPKIADFGLARNFRVNQTEANTGRVVGTFGYMPPEYVANGQFSTKSDVYSFGVLILEIIGGKKNSSFHQIDGSVSNLVTHVWRLRNNGSLLELVDPAIGENYDKDEVIRCIHIGLLCVQENPDDRPSMSTIFRMLTNVSITLPVPQPPGFFFRERSEPNPLAERLLPGPSTSMSFTCSVDDASITSVRPR
ncbi:unnamed protein product [Arabidopsis thaliana]|nr:unnamed protein product [Arabidopsis thaliana]